MGVCFLGERSGWKEHALIMGIGAPVFRFGARLAANESAASLSSHSYHGVQYVVAFGIYF